MNFHKSIPLLVATLALLLIGCGRDHMPTPEGPNSAAVAPAGAGVSANPVANPDVENTTMNSQPASKAPLLAIVTKADWCSICKANGARVVELLGKTSQDGSLEIVANDITSDATAGASAEELSRRGIKNLVDAASPGTIYFVDPKTRKRLAEITVAHQNEEIAFVTDLARKRLTP